ncbi:MAG: heparan-alpha-glucosaminide N-acetyltransferase domain-containing protein [Pseudonocardia sp.]
MRPGEPRRREIGARAPATGEGTGRVRGVDAARALAQIGMVATHTLLLREGGAPTTVALLAEGRASALFAVLAGVGVALYAGGPRRPSAGRERWALGAGLAVRGLIVGLLGLLLVELDPPVLVILSFYGLLFLVAVPLLRLSARALLVLAVLACVLTPVISHLLRPGRHGVGSQEGVAALTDPAGLLFHLAVDGFYPVLTWTTYLCAGMATGRLDLRRPGVAWALLGGGAAVSVLAGALSGVLLRVAGPAIDAERLAGRFYGTAPTDTWWWLAVDAPHSGAPLDLASTTGGALAVLGAMLLLARRSPAAAWLPAAVGAVPLTLYVVHALALAAYPPAGDHRAALLVAHLAGAAILGAAVALTGRRGPLEAAVSAASRAARAAGRGAGGGRAGGASGAQ